MLVLDAHLYRYTLHDATNYLLGFIKEPKMYYYRLYFLDIDDNHIIDVQDFRANGDAAAIMKAGLPVGGQARELWNQHRRVLELT